MIYANATQSDVIASRKNDQFQVYYSNAFVAETHAIHLNICYVSISYEGEPKSNATVSLH